VKSFAAFRAGWMLVLALVLAPVQAAVQVQVAGNTATADVDIGGVQAELILTFDAVDALSADKLGIKAQLVSLTDPLLLLRLPSASLTSIPAALPLLITVEPPLLGGLAFNNTVRVEVHTHALPYTAGSQLRLFKAPLGGTFVDITDEVAPGSVRTRGTIGGFSEFLVLLDLRPTSSVVAEKFSALNARLGAVPTAQRGALSERLAAAQAAVSVGQYAAAIAALDEFRALVSQDAGGAIRNRWSTTQRGGNVAGDLLAGAASLKFSIGYLRDYGD